MPRSWLPRWRVWAGLTLREKKKIGCWLGDIFWNGADGIWNLWDILGTGYRFLQHVWVQPAFLHNLRSCLPCQIDWFTSQGNDCFGKEGSLRTSGREDLVSHALKKYLPDEWRSSRAGPETVVFRAWDVSPNTAHDGHGCVIGAGVSERLVVSELTNPYARLCQSGAILCLPPVLSSVNGQCVTMCPFRTTAVICHC